MSPVSDPNPFSQMRRNSGRDFKCLMSDSITVVKCTDKGRWKHNIIKQNKTKKQTLKKIKFPNIFAIDSGKSSWHKIFQYIQWADVTTSEAGKITGFQKCCLKDKQPGKQNDKGITEVMSEVERPITKTTNFVSLPKYFARRALSNPQSQLYTCWHCQKLLRFILKSY